MKWVKPELSKLSEDKIDRFLDRLHGEAYKDFFKDFFEELYFGEIMVLREPDKPELEPCEGRRP